MPAIPFALDDNQKAILYNRKTGRAELFWPVDAKEILRNTDEYSTAPIKDKTVDALPVNVIPNIQTPENRPKLESLKKPELLDYSKKIGLDLEISMTVAEIVDAIEEKWQEQDDALKAKS